MDIIKNNPDIIVLENSVDRYLCTICNPPIPVCSKSNNSLELHIRELHSDNSSIRCIYCSEFVSSVSITKHIDKHFQKSSTQPFVCPACPKSCDTMKSLAHHAMNVHQIHQKDIFYKCGHCDKSMQSPSDLKEHLSSTSLLMYHCCFPDCFVKSRSRDLLYQHLVRCHGSANSLYISTLSPFFSKSNSLDPSKPKTPSCFLCNQCYFGTIHLENFAQHLSCCRPTNPINSVASLSVTCVLYRCSVCNLTTNIRNILIEHVQESHSMELEDNAIITEDFTVPISEDCVNESYSNQSNDVNNLPNSSTLSQIANYPSVDIEKSLNSYEKIGIQDRLRSLCSIPSDFSIVNSVLSKSIDPRNSNDPHSIDSCEADEVGDGTDDQVNGEMDESDAYKDSCDDFGSNKVRIFNSTEISNPESKPDILNQVKTDEFVQLYFNESAFVNAYLKSGKFANPNNRVVQQIELDGILEKLKKFASYRVPILGRANQRRVAGCPECLKPFNHGFTDLKKHLMVTHLGIRRDISRFTIDFTHSSRNQYNTGISQNLDHTGNNSHSNQQPKQLAIRNGRVPLKQLRKKPIIPLSLTNPLNLSHSFKLEQGEKLPLDSSNGHIPLITDSNMGYTGGAPVHRVIPGTGVSNHCEDLQSMDEVCNQAPVGRGGIIPLDEMGNPIVAAVVAASQSQSSAYAGGTEIFLPKFGRQQIQLAYSLQVFKRLLEAYQVPFPERIQLINRMNHYARMHVVMDVLVPGGAQKRFSCPACMYTSVHSLADIRKHIMGSHCGISTKRFRLCLRASRHDTTTYRLHSDDRMIRFVEDHRRRLIQLADNQSNFANSYDSDSEDVKVKPEDTESNVKVDGVPPPNPIFNSEPSNDQEELETQIIETDQFDSGPFDEADDESDHRFLVSDCVEQSPGQQIKLVDESLVESVNNTQSLDDSLGRGNEEFHRRIELPYSKSVLRILLEKEGMTEQYDDIVNRMNVYSKHYLTVVSRGNRIYAYICICGRRFAVVREEIESEIRPASLADCRRHILGVHARVPQELLTLCCQASRISKESNYRLYADSSLLAMAEQHKYRSSRTQSYNSRKSDIGGTSPLKRPLEPFVPNDREDNVTTSGDSSSHIHNVGFLANSTMSQMNSSFLSSGLSQVAMKHSISYPTNVPLLPMSRAPNSIKNEFSVDSETLSSSESNEVVVDHFQHVPPDGLNDHDRYKPPINPYKKTFESGLLEENSLAYDLEVPRRPFSPEESVIWSQRLNLPEAWTLERIVRLVYSPPVFEHQLKSLLPEGDSFITELHERMRIYARHSVYIVRSHDSILNSFQRIYVCCACLSTSQHGFGDVRKHILGVHAHVPERYKSAAMSSSRLNRDDYGLYTDSQLLQLATTSWRGSQVTANKYLTNGTRNVRRRFRPAELTVLSKIYNPERPSIKRKCLGPEDDLLSNLDPNSFTIEQSSLLESPMSNDHSPNGHTSVSSISENLPGITSDDYRPPIVLTLPYSKVFEPMKNVYSDVNKVVEDLVPHDLSCSTGSRSRRSMILKSKRPCPTSI